MSTENTTKRTTGTELGDKIAWVLFVLMIGYLVVLK